MVGSSFYMLANLAMIILICLEIINNLPYCFCSCLMTSTCMYHLVCARHKWKLYKTVLQMFWITSLPILTAIITSLFSMIFLRNMVVIRKKENAHSIPVWPGHCHRIHSFLAHIAILVYDRKDWLKSLTVWEQWRRMDVMSWLQRSGFIFSWEEKIKALVGKRGSILQKFDRKTRGLRHR